MRINPLLATTKVTDSPWEWRPGSFEEFLEELASIKMHCREIDHLAVFRGHRDCQWLLDSTFVRYVKESILGISPLSRVYRPYRLSVEYQRLIGGLFLYKFGTSTTPSKELVLAAEEHGIDPWFEWMKRIQQYPEDDLGPIRGSFLLDWSFSEEVALYFANESRHPNVDGAVWILDVSATGPVLHQEMMVGEMLQIIQSALHNDTPLGLPLVFCPRKQIECLRAKNQDAVYIAQMDLRCDLAEIWSALMKEQRIDGHVFLKLILPKGTTAECTRWLDAKRIVHGHIYPDNVHCPKP